MEILKTIITCSAFTLSVFAFIFTRRSWIEANRPIVTAEVVTHRAGNVGIAFSIIVHNTGNRPASNVRLYATKQTLDAAVSPRAPEAMKKEISAIFSQEGTIPILHQGKSVPNGFGNTNVDDTQSTLIYNSIIPITIEYKDLYSRTYETKQDLIIKDSTYFAGSGWDSVPTV